MTTGHCRRTLARVTYKLTGGEFEPQLRNHQMYLFIISPTLQESICSVHLAHTVAGRVSSTLFFVNVVFWVSYM